MLDKDTSSDSCGVGQTSALAGESKEKERRRKRYKYALVKWRPWDGDKYALERKEDLTYLAQFMGVYETICDWEPERVLRGMLKLLKEDKQ